MKIKVSEYIANFLVEHGINYNFTVTGGGAMYLNVAFGHAKGMTNIYCQHEQAAAMAAEGYYRMSGNLAIVCCTTGPGGTNTLTGVLGGWLDSIPMLIISGQVKWSTTVASTGLPMRIFGDQEFDIVEVAKPMTKYAVMITKPEMVKYHLQKALCLAKLGRPGPVWLDIPQNIQNADIDTDDLVEFDECELQNYKCRPVSKKTLELIIEKIKSAKRPVILGGVEIRTNGAFEEFNELIAKLNVPIVTSFDSIDIITEDNVLYAGRAGDVANRAGNWAVQNSDVLLVIGSRLGIRQVGYATETWARKAFVIMVYPDGLEITKPNIHVELPIKADIKEFCKLFCEFLNESLSPRTEWISICEKWRSDYPVVTKERHYKKSKFTNIYWFIHELDKMIPDNAPIITGNGSAVVASASIISIRNNQRFIFNSGCASMGWGLPASIGACFANDKKETYCITGDGSIQMNLQELQTLVFHKLPIKIFLINNQGYHSIRQTQNNLFKELSKVGIGPESGDLSFPDMSKIAAAYGIPYFSIHSDDEISGVLPRFVTHDGFALLEIFVDTEQVFEPKPMAKKLPDGTLASPPLEDLYPFLDRDVLRKIMFIPLVGEE